MKRFIRTDLGRANQLGDGAPLVWLFEPKWWTGAEVRRAECHGTTMRYGVVAPADTGDVMVIPKAQTDLKTCRQEFFRVMAAPGLFP